MTRIVAYSTANAELSTLSVLCTVGQPRVPECRTAGSTGENLGNRWVSPQPEEPGIQAVNDFMELKHVPASSPLIVAMKV